MSAKHTPGPWEVSMPADPDFPSLPERPEVIHVRLDGSVRFVCKTFGFDDASIGESMANAALIAAAPDLLAALEHAQARLVHAHGPVNPNDALHDEIAAAISRARGEGWAK